jgi:hypothetical protein
LGLIKFTEIKCDKVLDFRLKVAYCLYVFSISVICSQFRECGLCAPRSDRPVGRVAAGPGFGAPRLLYRACGVTRNHTV